MHEIYINPAHWQFHLTDIFTTKVYITLGSFPSAIPHIYFPGTQIKLYYSGRKLVMHEHIKIYNTREVAFCVDISKL